MTANQSDIAQRNHRNAVRFFWAWLIFAAWLSLAGNVVHAWLTAEAVQWLAAGVAAVAPTVLLLAVHGLAMLAKVTASGAIYRVSVAATGALALGAFILSFAALRDLAVIATIRPALAPVLPLVIDAAIAVATLALVAIGDKPAPRGRSATRSADAAATPSATMKRANAGVSRDVPRLGHRDSAASVGASALSSVGDSTRILAARLVEEKVTRQPIDVVARILAENHSGQSVNRIATDLGVHHSVVSKVVNAAAPIREQLLETA